MASAKVIVFGYGSLGVTALETCDRQGVVLAWRPHHELGGLTASASSASRCTPRRWHRHGTGRRRVPVRIESRDDVVTVHQKLRAAVRHCSRNALGRGRGAHGAEG